MCFGKQPESDDCSVSLESIIARWTYCYHITAVVNLRVIRRLRILHPATMLFQQARRDDLLSCRRTQDVHIAYQDQTILVRNQAPLDPDRIDLRSAESFGDYVARLNRHVFFWPGTASCPTPDGVRMFRNAGVRSILIRVPTRSLMQANDRAQVYLSTCNSGTSWIVEGGKKSQRGSDVFHQAECFTGLPERVEEIAFSCSVTFPDDSECSAGLGQPWRSLFAHTNDQQRTDAKIRPDVIRCPPKGNS